MYNFEQINLKNFYKKFMTLEENSNLIQSLEFFDTLIDGNTELIICLKEKEVIGLLSFDLDINNNILEKLTVSVKKEYRNKGISKKLIELQFLFASKNNFVIKESKYSQMGNLYLRKYNKFFSDKLKVEMI